MSHQNLTHLTNHPSVMILCFLITGISFIFFLKSRALKPLPPWASNMRLLPLCFWNDLSFFPIHKLTNYTLLTSYLSHSFSYKMFLKKKPMTTNCIKVEKKAGDEENDQEQLSVLDLPDLALESILERLSPVSLCKMACVSSFLKERCMSDHLWKKHMRQKWGRLIGQAAHTEWQWHIASSHHPGDNLGSNNIFANRSKPKGLTKLLSFTWIRSKVDGEDDDYDDGMKERASLPLDSIMARYLALENGKLWFPAQVYNRENGHVGFMLSCYDAEVCYDPRTDTFQARYPPHGSRAMAIENGVEWERLRAPPIDTCPHDLHVSDCLDELQLGDPIEIQWRRNKDFPYGWWYGVVGHLESCDGNANHCHCHKSDRVVLEFNQYAVGSRWRHATINRKEHREEGNEADGFYGGIRKLHSQQDISTWNRLWPSQVLE